MPSLEGCQVAAARTGLSPHQDATAVSAFATERVRSACALRVHCVSFVRALVRGCAEAIVRKCALARVRACVLSCVRVCACTCACVRARVYVRASACVCACVR
eukprot:4746327-Pleurochrysis_carterae.AAC.1